MGREQKTDDSPTSTGTETLDDLSLFCPSLFPYRFSFTDTSLIRTRRLWDRYEP
jgi:hypothetical protein